MQLTVWSWATALSKVVFYSGAALALATVMLWLLIYRSESFNIVGLLKRLKTLSFSGLLLAGLAVVSYFFIQVGAFAEQGWHGMWDPFVLQMLWQSGNGDMLIYRLSALVLVAGAVLSMPKHNTVSNTGVAQGIRMLTFAVALVIMAISFSFIGHSATQGLWVKAALSLHVLIALLWLGSLWPLIFCCDYLDNDALYKIMHRYGQIAVLLVGILVLMGAILVFNLLGENSLTLTSQYVRLLLIKLTFFALILSLAATHKFKRVPALIRDDKSMAVKRLRRSIKLEAFIGLSILTVTAMLSSWVGPTH